MRIISRKGIKLEKQYTSLDNPIYEIDPPEYVHIPLIDCDKDQFDTKYEIGDYIPQYGLIGRNRNGFGYYAPFCGTYMGIETNTNDILGKYSYIVFNMHIGMSSTPYRPTDIESLTSDEIIAISKRSGIIDEIDNIPLYKKLEAMRKKQASLLIADCIEDEVFSTSAFAQLGENGDDAGAGLALAARAVGIKNYKIAVSSIPGYRSSIKEDYNGTGSIIVDGKYPARYKLFSIYNRKGVFAIGIGACIELYRAASNGDCHTTCVVTIDGNCISRSANLRVPIGTPLSYLLDICKLKEDPKYIIIGDLISGKTITDTDMPVIPGMNCILAIKDIDHVKTQICTSCGRCAENCPSNLLPFKARNAMINKNYKQLDRMLVNRCTECGVCTFVCPCGIDVMADIIKAKEENKIYREGLNKLKADKLMYDEQIAQLKEKEKTASEEEKAEIKEQIKQLMEKEMSELSADKESIQSNIENNNTIKSSSGFKRGYFDIDIEGNDTTNDDNIDNVDNVSEVIENEENLDEEQIEENPLVIVEEENQEDIDETEDNINQQDSNVKYVYTPIVSEGVEELKQSIDPQQQDIIIDEEVEQNDTVELEKEPENIEIEEQIDSEILTDQNIAEQSEQSESEDTEHTEEIIEAEKSAHENAAEDTQKETIADNNTNISSNESIDQQYFGMDLSDVQLNFSENSDDSLLTQENNVNNQIENIQEEFVDNYPEQPKGVKRILASFKGLFRKNKNNDQYIENPYPLQDNLNESLDEENIPQNDIINNDIVEDVSDNSFEIQENVVDNEDTDISKSSNINAIEHASEDIVEDVIPENDYNAPVVMDNKEIIKADDETTNINEDVEEVISEDIQEENNDKNINENQSNDAISIADEAEEPKNISDNEPEQQLSDDIINEEEKETIETEELTENPIDSNIETSEQQNNEQEYLDNTQTENNQENTKAAEQNDNDDFLDGIGYDYEYYLNNLDKFDMLDGDDKTDPIDYLIGSSDTSDDLDNEDPMGYERYLNTLDDIEEDSNSDLLDEDQNSDESDTPRYVDYEAIISDLNIDFDNLAKIFFEESEKGGDKQ